MVASFSTPALRRYLVVTSVAMAIYVGFNIVAMVGALDSLPAWARWAFAFLVSAPIALQIWATIVAMRDSDEYIRAVMGKRFILAAGAAFALFSGWGFAESYADAPHASGWLVYPLFWGLYGVVTPFVRSSV